MRRHVVILVAVVTALAAALPAIPTWAATPPTLLGSLDGRAGGGNGGTGILSIVGWALASDGVDAVDILVDGIINGRAAYGRSRPGVTAAFPTYPDAKLPGFAYSVDTTHFLNGQHSIVARVRSKTGATLDLGPKSFDFNNAPQDLLPFGAIEFPNKDAEIFGTCSLGTVDDPLLLRDFGLISIQVPRRYTVVSGYVVDAGQGDEVDGDGVGYVELLVDGAILYNSVTDCFFSSKTGGLTNCFGVFRPDIGATYPTLRDSIHGGFRYVLDLSRLIKLNLYQPGKHTLEIRAGDRSGTTVNIARTEVTFSCDDFIGNDGSFGLIDIPPAGLTYGGQIVLTGWALDFQTVAAVTLLIDGKFFGVATLGLPRPGVSTLYPGYPQSLAPGWSIGLDTTKFSNGVHFIQAVATDFLGVDTVIGERPFTIRNPHQ
jgi:hypothetical protein